MRHHARLVVTILSLASALPSQSLFTTATFGPVGMSPYPGSVGGIIHGDFTNDGITDVVYGSAVQLRVLPGGGGSLGQPIVTTLSESGAPIMSWDVNLDGNLDLICLKGLTVSVRIVLGNGDGTFVEPPNPGANPIFVATKLDVAGADLDNDGVLEVVVTCQSSPINPSSTIVKVYEALPTGALSEVFSYSPPATFHVSRNPVIGDVTGDGLQDIIFQRTPAYSIFPPPPPLPTPEIMVLEATAGGAFTVLGPFAAPIAHRQFVGDLDGDGTADLVRVVNSPSATLQVDVHFGMTGTFSVGSSHVTNVPNTEIGSLVSSLTDYDLDGILDIGIGSEVLRIFPAYAGGTSSPVFPQWFDSMQWPPGLNLQRPHVTVDVDGDGDQDVVLTGSDQASPTSTIYAGIAYNRTISWPACSGTGPLTVTLGTPAPGNPTFAMGLSGAPPNTPVALCLSLAGAFIPWGPCVVRIDPTPGQLLLPDGPVGVGTTDATGATLAFVPIPAIPALLGTDYFLEYLVEDPIGPIILTAVRYSLSPTRRILLW